MQRFELKSLDRARSAFGSVQLRAGFGSCGAHGFCALQANVLMPQPNRSGEEKSPPPRKRKRASPREETSVTYPRAALGNVIELT
jgi:hypothetical protein